MPSLRIGLATVPNAPAVEERLDTLDRILAEAAEQQVAIPTLTRWGDPDNPYYEKAMLMRSIENTIYFASVNYAFAYPKSATSIIGPEGDLLTYLPYREEGLLVYDLDPDTATGLIASRYAPGLYPE